MGMTQSSSSRGDADIEQCGGGGGVEVEVDTTHDGRPSQARQDEEEMESSSRGRTTPSHEHDEQDENESLLDPLEATAAHDSSSSSSATELLFRSSSNSLWNNNMGAVVETDTWNHPWSIDRQHLVLPEPSLPQNHHGSGAENNDLERPDFFSSDAGPPLHASGILFRGGFASNNLFTLGDETDAWNQMMQEEEGDHTAERPWLTDDALHVALPHAENAVPQAEPPALFGVTAAVDEESGHAAVVSAPLGDVTTTSTDQDQTTFMDFAAIAVRAVCPTEVSEVFCPTDILAEELFGGNDDFPTPWPAAAEHQSSSSSPPPIHTVDSWLPLGRLPEALGYNMTTTPAAQMRPKLKMPPGADGTDGENETAVPDFVPILSSHHEWMGRSIETLFAGHTLPAPVLAPAHHAAGSSDNGAIDSVGRKPSSASRNRAGRSFVGRRRNDSRGIQTSRTGPNVVLSLVAREMTGRPSSARSVHPADRLREMGGSSLYAALDDPAGGIVSETALLEKAMDRGDWTETETITSRLVLRLIGDPSLSVNGNGNVRDAIDDPTLPPSASPFYAGGGRLGLERGAFVLAGGVQLLLRLFHQEAFVGGVIGETNDARDLSVDFVANKVGRCWNEVLLTLRELVYALPSLVDNGTILDGGGFMPFLFTLLVHASLFDSAAALIEEILSIQSLAMPATATQDVDPLDASSISTAVGHVSPATTFFLGNIPDLYELWNSFSCRQLAHFCRLLAFLIFEPEDRQALESPAVLKSMELLHLRRNRAVRAGRDATVEMNQALLLGDQSMIQKLLQLLRVMNYAPPLRRRNAYHVMAHFSFIADTLGMVGLNELNEWNEIGRLDLLARSLSSGASAAANLQVSELGNVTEMLESLSGSLLGDPLEPATQLGHIIHVINAAQQAGVVVGSRRSGRARRSETDHPRASEAGGGAEGYLDDSDAENDNVASNLLPWADRVLVRRLFPSVSGGDDDGNGAVQVVGIGIEEGPDGESTIHHFQTGRRDAARVTSPEDAANLLQFNALILAPYQVEVLFILCTLLGGRRKIDMQRFLRDNGLIETLDEMFHRLSWGASSLSSQPSRFYPSAGSDGIFSDADNSNEPSQSNGIHGPGCECTPESALSVQFLRLLHNFCDRDCDNYSDRRLLLSESERTFMFSAQSEVRCAIEVKPGLLSKIMQTFMNEPEDSPYRFWLASCVESYLRGSSNEEQLFAANSGLLAHIVEDVISDRLHCAGNLQTSFDLLGEICKGNEEVLKLLMSGFTEESFRSLMGVAASNLVDSNVFFRSLLITLERLSLATASESSSGGDNTRHESAWRSRAGSSSRSYLTHSWWESSMVQLPRSSENSKKGEPKAFDCLEESDEKRASDWFPVSYVDDESSNGSAGDALGHHAEEQPGSSAQYGWIFSPANIMGSDAAFSSTWRQDDPIYAPNTIERLSWFLATNRARLLRDLLRVVDLLNINHENICCLNTAVVITILANRYNELPQLLNEIRTMNEGERLESSERLNNSAGNRSVRDDVVDRTFIQATKFLDLDDGKERENMDPRRLTSSSRQLSMTTLLGDRTDVLRNFRKLLWFWFEYYTHRGRDRLSLEFSSHIRFHEWKRVIAGLVADDASRRTSLVPSPIRLPRSPYERSSRVSDMPRRAA